MRVYKDLRRRMHCVLGSLYSKELWVKRFAPTVATDVSGKECGLAFAFDVERLIVLFLFLQA